MLIQFDNIPGLAKGKSRVPQVLFKRLSPRFLVFIAFMPSFPSSGHHGRASTRLFTQLGLGPLQTNPVNLGTILKSIHNVVFAFLHNR